MHDIMIIGGGPAGLTAALYAARAGKSVIVIEKNSYGGQITFSPKVENFPAAGSVSGMEFADRLLEQVMKYPVQLELDEVLSLEKKENIFTVKTAFGCTFEGKSVIIATGAEPKKLGIEGEDRFTGKGVSFCAVCDGEFYKNKDVAVIGGGNSALQEALYLSDICRKVVLIHRRNSFRADDVLAEAVQKKVNIELMLESRIKKISGNDTLEYVTVSHMNVAQIEAAEETISVNALFIAIGHKPNTEIFTEYIDINDDGYIKADENCATTAPGIFIAGDCRDKNVRQLTTAAADGTNAAIEACRYIDATF